MAILGQWERQVWDEGRGGGEEVCVGVWLEDPHRGRAKTAPSSTAHPSEDRGPGDEHLTG